MKYRCTQFLSGTRRRHETARPLFRPATCRARALTFSGLEQQCHGGMPNVPDQLRLCRTSSFSFDVGRQRSYFSAGCMHVVVTTHIISPTSFSRSGRWPLQHPARLTSVLNIQTWPSWKHILVIASEKRRAQRRARPKQVSVVCQPSRK